jgi:hypothetical protein
MFASVAAMGTAIFVVIMMGPGLALLRAVWAPMAVSAASVSVFHKPDIVSIYRESRYIEIVTDADLPGAAVRVGGGAAHRVVVPRGGGDLYLSARDYGSPLSRGRLQEE